MRFFNKKHKPLKSGEKNTSLNTVRIFTMHGRKFVTGLFWQPLTSPRNYMSEARDIGKKRHWDIVTIRKTVRIQAGFVNKDAGVEKGMYSLAAVLAGQLGDSWVGVFQVNADEYAVVAVHDGSIVPGYDVLTGRDEALNLLKQGYQLFQYESEQIFAPADFQFSQYEKNLSELLAPGILKNEYRLKQLTFGLNQKELFTLGLSVLAFILVVYGWNQYKIYKDKKLQAESIRLNRAGNKEQGPQLLPHPWAKMAKAEDFTQVCITEIYALPLNIAGWQIEESNCDSKGVTAIYRRQIAGTTVKDFIKSMQGHFNDTPLIADGGNAATVKKSINMPPGDDEKLAATHTVQDDFLSYFQEIDVQLMLAEQSVSLAPQHFVDWRKFSYEFRTPISPTLLIAGLPDKNGVRVTKMVVKYSEDDAHLAWTVIGELYASK